MPIFKGNPLKMSTKNNDLILRIYPIFIVYFIYLFIGLALTQHFGRDQLHLIINQLHLKSLDYFFDYYTQIGTSGLFTLLILYIILKSNWITLGYLIGTEIIAGVINLIIKKTFFNAVYRSAYYFQQKQINLYLIDNYKMQDVYTFPSGHSLMAIVIAMTMCTMTKNRTLQFLFILNFVVIASSRMYLSKHFMIDTIGGATLAFFTFIFVYYVLNNQNQVFWNKPILTKNDARN